ncbi:MAG: hypothetical protein ACR2HV_02660 [Acidimicrobiales bacterium]
MRQLSGQGFGVDLPQGWDGRIFNRLNEASERTNRALHAASFPLPADPGDFAAEVVGQMGDADVLVALLEYDREVAGTALFAAEGLPVPLRPDSFSPAAMPKKTPGKTGAQYFFTLAGRPLCLFVVLGSHNDRARLAPVASAVAATIRVSP